MDGAKSGAEGSAEGPHGVRAQDQAASLKEIDRVCEAARKDKGKRFTRLPHHIDAAMLGHAHCRLKREASAGVNRMTCDAYGEGLESRLRDLESRIHKAPYRVKTSLRAYISKPDGRQRPLGIAELKDKIIHGTVVEVLDAIYQRDFLAFSCESRPGRGQHDAPDTLTVGIGIQAVNWIRDADIKRFFDNISHKWMMRFVEHRIGDRRVLRLIRKCLVAGVVEDVERRAAKRCTPQGAVISPLLTDIHLHYFHDLWVRQWRRRHLAECDDRGIPPPCPHLWRRALRLRSQRNRTTWKDMDKLAARWLPSRKILDSRPSQRFRVKHPRLGPYGEFRSCNSVQRALDDGRPYCGSGS